MNINGLPVRDAKRSITLHIAPADIRDAEAKDPAHCAAALACRRSLPKCVDAIVHVGRIYVKYDGQNFWNRYITPASLKTEIVALDRGGSFSPGEYRAVPPPISQSAGKHLGGPKANFTLKTGKYSAAKTRKYHVTENVRKPMPKRGHRP